MGTAKQRPRELETLATSFHCCGFDVLKNMENRPPAIVIRYYELALTNDSAGGFTTKCTKNTKRKKTTSCFFVLFVVILLAGCREDLKAAKKVFVLGCDGMDPKLVRKLMDE